MSLKHHDATKKGSLVWDPVSQILNTPQTHTESQSGFSFYRHNLQTLWTTFFKCVRACSMNMELVKAFSHWNFNLFLTLIRHSIFRSLRYCIGRMGQCPALSVDLTLLHPVTLEILYRSFNLCWCSHYLIIDIVLLVSARGGEQACCFSPSALQMLSQTR